MKPLFEVGRTRTSLSTYLVRWMMGILQISRILTEVHGQKAEPLSPFQFITHEELIPFDRDNRSINGSPSDASNFKSFLEPCNILTLEMPCSSEEYDNNDDCLPQKTDNCNHSKELFCLSGVCLPNCHPHKEMYDHVEGKCFRKVGSDCRAPQNSSTPTPSLYSTVPVPPCEKNAVCERGQCRCEKTSSYDHNFNKCVMYAAYNQHCSENTNCDTKSDILCRENQCQCKSPSTQYFHSKRKRCYVMIGEVCSSGLQFCPDSSICLRRSKMAKRKPELANSSEANGGPPSRLSQFYHQHLEGDYEAEGGEEHFIGILGEEEDANDEDREFVCKCDKGYGFTNDKRFCLGLHGSRCNTLHRCNSERGLKCSDGICICSRETEKEQVYSDKFQTCITAPGASCNDKDEDICPIGASCKEGKCVCNDNLIPLPGSHSCVKSHGMPCKVVDDPFEPRCNSEIGLKCIQNEGKCLCSSSDQFYDVSLGHCRTFDEIKGKIPVVHFTPPDDREYNFHERNGAMPSTTFPINFELILAITIKMMIISCLPFS